MNMSDLPISDLIENPATGSHQRVANGSDPNGADDICTVCGTSAGECRESLSRLNHDAKMVSICSPQYFSGSRIASPLTSVCDHWRTCVMRPCAESRNAIQMNNPGSHFTRERFLSIAVAVSVLAGFESLVPAEDEWEAELDFRRMQIKRGIHAL